METQAPGRRQDQIVTELMAIRAMKRGTVTHQRVRVRRRPKGESLYGPYPLLTWKEAGRTKSLRLTTPEDVVWAEQAVENYRRFAALCREYKRLAEHLPLGSGPCVIEAACKNLAGKRLKLSAMQWAVRGTNSIIATRCATLSRRSNEYWDDAPLRYSFLDAGPSTRVFAKYHKQ